MSKKFLYTAVDRDGKSVTERIEAENLSQARYKLELRSYSEITFYESELSEDVNNLFDQQDIDAKNKHLKNQIALLYDNSIKRQLFNILKATSFLWILIIGSFIYAQNAVTFFILIGAIILTLYLCIPGFIHKKLHDAHCWNENKKILFWVRALKFFNPISFIKFPEIEIDYYLSCVDARKGELAAALQRMEKYRNNAKVSARLLNLKLLGIYGNAKEFGKLINLYEEILSEEDNHTEEMLDYATCLARRHKQTALAKNILGKVFDKQSTILANLFIPYCQGIIEVEEENYPLAEFYLKQALKELKPFERNSFLIGLKSEVKAFLAISLGKLGQKEEAEKLFDESKIYLNAVNETDLIQRCESVLR